MIILLLLILGGAYLWWRRRRKAAIQGRGLARAISSVQRRDPGRDAMWIGYPPGRWRRAGGRR